MIRRILGAIAIASCSGQGGVDAGVCDITCGANQHCESGVCVDGCAPDQTLCGNATLRCSNLQTSPTDCGACGLACAAGQTCVAGQCSGCTLPLVACGTQCSRLSNDPGHCGSCANRCPAGRICVHGACASRACIEPEASAGAVPQHLEAADFNRDGRLDLLAAGGRTLSVLLEIGPDRFAAPVLYIQPDGGDIADIAVADFDRDGLSDVALVHDRLQRVVVMMGRDGGALVPGAVVATANFPQEVAAGDVNRDMLPDLLVRPFGAPLELFMNQGDGGFGPKQVLDAGVDGSEIRLVDMDSDGFADLVMEGRAGIELRYGSGQGTFTPPVSFPAGVVSFAVGDLDGDGRPDLAAIVDIAIRDFRTYVALNRGARTFSPWAGYTALRSAEDIAIGDLSGDGKAEVVQSSSNFDFAGVLVNEGDGGFSDFFTYLNIGARGAVVGEFTGDGVPDVAVGNLYNRSVNVLAGLGDGRLAAPIEHIELNNIEEQLSIVDIDGDSSNDIATLRYISQSARQIAILRNDGYGGFSRPAYVALDAGSDSMVFADTNADGLVDIVATDPNRSTLEIRHSVGDAGFGSQQSFATTVRGFCIGTADFNGDGRADFALSGPTSAGVVLASNGSFTSQPPVALASTGPDNLAVGDFNGDSKADVVIASGGLRLLAGTGAGTLLPPTAADGGEAAVELRAGDLDGDGHLDVVSRELNAVRVYFGAGDGGFSQRGASPLLNSASGGVAVGDVSGDGVADIVILTGSAFTMGPYAMRVVLGSRTGVLGPTYDFPVYGEHDEVTIGDLDHDAKLDVVVAAGRTHQVFLNLCMP